MKICVYVCKPQYLSLSRLQDKQCERALRNQELQVVKKGWREANLRARGAKAGEDLDYLMRLAAGKVKGKDAQLTLRFDVCFRCGIPI